MRIAVIGSGGREHALTWKLRKDPQVTDIFCLPGNAGTSEIADNSEIKATDLNSILDFCKKNKPHLVVIGPEDPLSEGLANILRESSFKVFGPGKIGAQIESSKIFAKRLMEKYDIPTGKADAFEDFESALNYLKNIDFPIVIKADGLAAGKGVFICQSTDEAEEALKSCFIDKQFGASGNKVLIEEFLQGQEVSLLVFSDGNTYLPMVPSQDHKAVYDGDKGPNTGGMGCYSPVPIFDDRLFDISINKVVEPTVQALKSEGIDFRGVIYCGLILTKEGPKVLEYNARFGDPETQVILPRMRSNLTDILSATADKELSGVNIDWNKQVALTVVMASGGYPGSYQTGLEIKGIHAAESDSDIVVFHAGTSLKDGKITTAGGRVLNVTSVADDFETARRQAYEAAGKIEFQGKYSRTDIGLRAISQSKKKEEAWLK